MVFPSEQFFFHLAEIKLFLLVAQNADNLIPLDQ